MKKDKHRLKRVLYCFLKYGIFYSTICVLGLLMYILIKWARFIFQGLLQNHLIMSFIHNHFNYPKILGSIVAVLFVAFLFFIVHFACELSMAATRWILYRFFRYIVKKEKML